MTDYKTMYYILCDRSSQALDVLSGSFVQTEQTLKAAEILSQALQDAEQVYINTCEPEQP